MHRIEQYLDAVPRARADAEQVGPFTLFRAGLPLAVLRPSQPGVGPGLRDGRRRQGHPRLASASSACPRPSSGSPRSRPTSATACRDAGLQVTEHPLLVHHDPLAVPVPDGIRIRRLDDADDPAIPAGQVVARLGVRGIRHRRRRRRTRPSGTPPLEQRAAEASDDLRSADPRRALGVRRGRGRARGAVLGRSQPGGRRHRDRRCRHPARAPVSGARRGRHGHPGGRRRSPRHRGDLPQRRRRRRSPGSTNASGFRRIGTACAAEPPDVAAQAQRNLRAARLTALTTAFSDAVTMFGSTPTPQNTWPSMAHSR